MAFGGLKGTLSGSATSITASMAISTGGPVTVVVGDLVYAVICEQTTATASACTDNLGNVYEGLNAADAGATITGRVFWSRVTVGGSLSSVTFTATASSNNVVGLAAIVEGPFLSIPKQTFYTLDSMAANLRFDQGDRLVTSVTNFGIAAGTLSRNGGKAYCEFTLVNGTAQDSIAFGVVNGTFLGSWTPGTTFLGMTGNTSIGWGFADGSASVYRNGSVVTTIQSFTEGDTVCMAVDFINDRIWFRTNGGNWNNSGTANPSTNVGGIDISALGATLIPALENDLAGDIISANFGQTPYAQSVPSGYSNWDGTIDFIGGNLLNDNVTPYTCPATSTVFEQELVMCWLAHTGNVTLTATSPNTKAVQLNTATILTAAIGRQVIAAASAATPAWTSSGTPTESAYGTATFRREFTQIVSPGIISDSTTLYAPVVAQPVRMTEYAGSSPLYRYRYVRPSEAISPTRIQVSIPGGGAQNVNIALTSDVDSAFAPTVGGGTALARTSYAGAGLLYRYRRIQESVVTYGGSQSKPLFPGQISDADSLFAPGLLVIYNLLPSVFLDSEAFFAPSVTTVRTLLPSLFTDTDTFAAPSVANNLTPTLAVDADVFPTAVVAFAALQPSLFVATDVFYGPVVALINQLAPSLFVDSDTVFSASLTWVNPITPAVFVDAEAFYAPAILAGVVNLAPSVFVDSDTFYSPVLTLFVTPSLLVDSDAFSAVTVTGAGAIITLPFVETDSLFVPTVVLGAIPRAAYSEATTFYRYRYFPHSEVTTPRLSLDRAITPGLLVDVDSFVTHNIGGYVPAPFSYAGMSPMVMRSAFIPPMSVTVVIASPSIQTLVPGLFIEGDVLFAPSISKVITPALLVDGDSFFAPREDLSVTPVLFTDGDIFFAPSVARGAVDISPSPFVDADSFLQPAVAAAGLQIVLAQAITDVDTLYAPVVTAATVALSPALFTDTDVFFAPTLTFILAPSLFTDADSFFAPALALFVAPSLFSDSDTFFSPAVSVGAVNISPVLFTDADVFSAPIVATSGVQPIVPGLLVDADVFPVQAVGPGTVLVNPGLFVDSDIFFTSTLTLNVLPNLAVDADGFFGPAIGGSLSPSLFVDSDAFFMPLTATQLIPPLFVDTDAFFQPLVFISGVGVLPIMFVEADTFFAPAIIPGSTNLSPEMFIDIFPLFGIADSFYQPQLVYDQVVSIGRFVDEEILFAASVGVPTKDEPLIGRSLESDYGIRKSRLRRGPYIIGRR